MSPSRTLSDMSPALLKGSRLGLPRERQRKRFYKTRLCPYHFSKGANCKGGDHCSYAHSFMELRPSIDLTKTKLCTGFVNGSCSRPAAECPFAHGCEDLRSCEVRCASPGSVSSSGGGYCVNSVGMSEDIFMCGGGELARLLLEEGLQLEEESFLSALALPSSIKLVDVKNERRNIFFEAENLDAAELTMQQHFGAQR